MGIWSWNDEVNFSNETSRLVIVCELCDSEEGKRRDDGIFICDDCDEKFPIKEAT